MSMAIPDTLTAQDVSKILCQQIALFDEKGVEIKATLYDLVNRIKAITHKEYFRLLGLEILSEKERNQTLEGEHNPIHHFSQIHAFVLSAKEIIDAMKDRLYIGITDSEMDSLNLCLNQMERTILDVETDYFTEGGVHYKLAQATIDLYQGSFDE